MSDFLDLFHPYPGNRYQYISTDIDNIALYLNKLIENVGGVFRVSLYNIDKKFSSHNFDIELIDDLSNIFSSKARDNDKVIFKDIYHIHKDINRLTKAAYRSLANSAEIIILQQKDTVKKQDILELLEKHEFRAANMIENIFNDYNAFIGKKMHMWGNGL